MVELSWKSQAFALAMSQLVTCKLGRGESAVFREHHPEQRLWGPSGIRVTQTGVLADTSVSPALPDSGPSLGSPSPQDDAGLS